MKWLKRLQKPKNKSNIYKSIEGAELNEMELKHWLSNDTTLKILKILKFHRTEFLESLVNDSYKTERELNLALGRCKGYDDIIYLLEETASNQDDLEAILETYINNRQSL